MLLAKDPEGVSEVVNDLNGNLTHFYRVLQDEERFAKFRRRVEATPFSEHEWVRAAAMQDFPPACEIERAWSFFVWCRQSLAGRMKSFTGVTKTRTRRGMNNEVSAWLTAVEGLPAVHERLKRVLILNRDAVEVIRSQDSTETCFYLDPSYPAETRTAPAVYAHEMTNEQHANLLAILAALRGKFILSGYRCEMYDEAAAKHGWRREDVEMANHAAGGTNKRVMVESLWCNF